MVLVSHNYQETIKQLEIEIKQRVHSLATGQGASAEDQGEPLDAVGVDDSSKIKAGSSVVERPVCTKEVPGYIPGLTYLFSSHRGSVSLRSVQGERERSIFFRGHRYTLRDQDTTWPAACESVCKGHDKKGFIYRGFQVWALRRATWFGV